jgi:uncharacterized protein (TIGR03435 family)
MRTTILLALLTCHLAQAQTFDVASVKPSIPPTLKNLLMNAYDVKNYQITGPSWLDTERFDINATMPPDTTKEQFRVMLQNLLAERFKLTIHWETKELPVYSLVVNKGGPKLNESEPSAPVDPDAPPQPLPPGPSQPKIGPDGFPISQCPPEAAEACSTS